MSNPLLGAVFSRASDQIWSMLDLTDVLRLSMCAKVTTNLGMDSETIHDLLERNKNAMKVGNFTIKFPDELSIGLLRRILHTLNTGKEASVHIDAKSGRIILDVGTAFTEREVFRPSDLQPNTDNESEADNQEIFQHLEKCSMDEYDDFNPRHPKPRERAHRRGDSYFNSDIDMVVNELYSGLGPAGCDLKNIAASAAKDPELPTPPAKSAGGGDLKSRLLAKKKAAEGGAAGAAGPPLAPPRPSSPGCVTRLPYQLRASAELNCDSDEDK